MNKLNNNTLQFIKTLVLKNVTQYHTICSVRFNWNRNHPLYITLFPPQKIYLITF